MIKIPNPKWSIYIGLASSIFFGSIVMLLALTSHNYCNEFCMDFMCNADGSCSQLKWLHLLNYGFAIFFVIFSIIFIPSYCFQILDSCVKRNN